MVALLAFDLVFAHRGDVHISLRRAAGWSALWMVVGVAFGLVVLALLGGGAAGEYWSGFLMEKALSLDNVFVIAVLLGTFAVPDALKSDVLTFGIAVALMLRTVFIVAGVTLLELFHPVLYVMGALLIFTGIRLAISDDSGEDFADGRTMRLLRRVLPVGKEFQGRRIVAREDGARVATPLLAALLAVALADVIFAIDSIPAVLAITTDTFLVFAANAFALLGLRALYFLLDGMAQKFEYLHYGLGALLIFVGGKMLVEDIVGHLPVGVSLGVIVAVLGASVGASLLLSGRALGDRGRKRRAAAASPRRFSRTQQAISERGRLLGRRIPLRDLGQVVRRVQPEELEEQRRRAVQDGAELAAARLLDQPAFGQRGGRGLRRHAADARDLGAADRLQVGDDRERLGLGGRERGRARTGEQAPRGLLGVRVRGEREAAGDPPQHEAAALEVGLELLGRLGDRLLPGLQRVGELLDGDRVGREEEQRLELGESVMARLGAAVPGRVARAGSRGRSLRRVGRHRDRAERLVLLPRGLAALVELEQREDGHADRDAVGVLDRVVEAEGAAPQQVAQDAPGARRP